MTTKNVTMLSKNEEDYLRRIYELQVKAGRSLRASEIADALSVSTPSVSEMMRKMKKNGFVENKRYGTISLTKKGADEARKILRKHRILEVFFADLLGMKDTFHQEAHEIEHAISEKAELKLEKLLKNPKKCPDGDEIPPHGSRVISLSEAPLRTALRVLFTKLEKKDELARIKSLGMNPGQKMHIVKRLSHGPLILRLKESEVAIGKEIASSVFVEVQK